MSPSAEITTCSNKACRRKFPLVYIRCPYCKTKNPFKPQPKPAPEPEPKCTCLDPLHAGDNQNCPVHTGGQS